MYKALIIFLITLVITPASLIAQRGDWYNEPGDFAIEGEGTERSPYLIPSVAALVHIADRVNKWKGEDFHNVYFCLTADIDLGEHHWIPIGSEREQPFCGIFNGNGKTIRNLFIGEEDGENIFEAGALFGYIGAGAHISNLTVEGGEIIGGGRDSTSWAGVIAGRAYCHVAESRQDSIVIRNCHNRGVAVRAFETSTSVAGGLIAEASAFCEGEGMAVITIEGCTGTGSITGGIAAQTYAGGIVGKISADALADVSTPAVASCTILSCRNRGFITGGAAVSDEAITATGGILGYGYASAASYDTGKAAASIMIRRCINEGIVLGGAVEADRATGSAGGIAGFADSFTYGSGNTSARALLRANSSATEAEAGGGENKSTTAGHILGAGGAEVEGK